MEEWIMRGVVLVLMVWSVKGYISEKTKKQRPGDQYMTMDEIFKHCKEEHGQIMDGSNKELEHMTDLFKKDLVDGNKRFIGLETRLESHGKLLSSMNITLILIAEKNGIDKRHIARQTESAASLL